MKEVNSILNDYGTTIFTTMSALAVKHNAINLGQGFPDKDGPSDILNEAILATKNQSNQYPIDLGRQLCHFYGLIPLRLSVN